MKKRPLKVMMVGGLVAASLSIPVAPAQAVCAGYVDRHDEYRVGVWGCDSCPRPLYGPLDGEFQVVACLAAG